MRYLLTLLVLVIGLTSCEGPVGPEGPAGADGVVDVRTAVFDLGTGAMREQPDGMGQQYRFAIPELTDEIISEGLALSYTDLGTDGTNWTQLPVALRPGDSIIVNLTTVFATGMFAINVRPQCRRESDHQHPLYDPCAFDERMDGVLEHKIKVVLVVPDTGSSHTVREISERPETLDSTS